MVLNASHTPDGDAIAKALRSLSGACAHYKFKQLGNVFRGVAKQAHVALIGKGVSAVMNSKLFQLKNGDISGDNS